MNQIFTLLPVTAVAALSIACTSPYEAGVELGEEHVALVRNGELTYERFVEDLEEGAAEYDDEADQKKFGEGYDKGVAPVKDRITAMVVEHAAEDAGEAVGVMMEAFGRGVARAADGFLEAIEDIGERPRTAEDREKLQAVGRKIGKALKRLGDDLETVAEGVEEGVAEAEREAQ